MRTKKCLHKSTVLLLHCTSALNCNDFSSSFPQCGFFNHGGHWGEKNKPRTQRKHLLAKNSPRFIPANKLQTDFHCKGGRQVYKASRRRLQYTEVSQPLLQYGEVWKECTYTLINARSQKHTCVKAVTALQFSRLQSISICCIHTWTLSKPDLLTSDLLTLSSQNANLHTTVHSSSLVCSKSDLHLWLFCPMGVPIYSGHVELYVCFICLTKLPVFNE